MNTALLFRNASGAFYVVFHHFLTLFGILALTDRVFRREVRMLAGRALRCAGELHPVSGQGDRGGGWLPGHLQSRGGGGGQEAKFCEIFLCGKFSKR